MLPIFNLYFDCCSLYLFFSVIPITLQWFVFLYSYS